MSCITEILKIKGDKDFIECKGIAIEGGGLYKGYEYIITFVNTHRCGYVAIPATHPTFKSDDDYPDFDVHGGVTYFGKSRFSKLNGGHQCTDKWIGFDANHSCDSSDLETAEKYFGETDYIKFKKENPNEGYCLYGEPKVRTFKYMEQQCKNLIDQLIEKSA